MAPAGSAPAGRLDRARRHASELTNKLDGELRICADHVLEALSRDHEEGHVLHGDSGDRVGSIAEQGYLTQQITLDESFQDPLLSVNPATCLDRTLMDQIGFALRLIAFPEDHIAALECLAWYICDLLLLPCWNRRLSHGAGWRRT
jgi:hypothetical protein